MGSLAPEERDGRGGHLGRIVPLEKWLEREEVGGDVFFLERPFECCLELGDRAPDLLGRRKGHRVVTRSPADRKRGGKDSGKASLREHAAGFKAGSVPGD